MKEQQEKQVLKRPPRRWPRYVLGIVIIAVVALCIASLARSKYGLENSRYEITSGKVAAGADKTVADTDAVGDGTDDAASLRIVEIADLHNAVFGKNNSRLVDMIKAQEPDLILMVGDMVQEDEEDLTVVTNLIRDLSDTAPIYFSIGNHEEAYIRNFEEQDSVIEAETTDADTPGDSISESHLLSEIRAAGATVLDKSYEDITVNGTDIRIGGIYGYCLPATDSLRQEFTNQPDRIAEMDWLLTYQDTEKLKLLLCHMPVCWILNGSLEYYDVDVVFAGHAHGGQVRLPFVGGFYAPDQGWFPGREAGLYLEKTDEATETADSENTAADSAPAESGADAASPAADEPATDSVSTLVLTRGLGSEMKVPRFCNTPEVVTLDIYAEN